MEIFDKVRRANEIYATTIPFNSPIGAGGAQLWRFGTLSDGCDCVRLTGRGKTVCGRVTQVMRALETETQNLEVS